MPDRRWCAALLAFGFVTVLGCGRQLSEAPRAKSEAKKTESSQRFRPTGHVINSTLEGMPTLESDEPGVSVQVDGKELKKAPPADDPKDAPHAEKVKRKIKYTADLHLITDDFPKTEEALLALIDAHQAFLAFADVATTPGQPRTGTWRARVPVDKFESFRRGVAKIGEVERNNVNTEDVTAQFYDLENHIKNKKAQEDALRELLKKTTDKMENLLAVQRELASVRDSIERSEGQLRLLANLSDLTTVTIRVQERRKFDPEKPPESAEKPAFGSRVGKTFSESWQGLVDFVQDFRSLWWRSLPGIR